VLAKIEQAAAQLKQAPEWEQACRLVADLPRGQQLIAERVRELPLRLRDPDANEWSV
jgi:hypothetical protein